MAIRSARAAWILPSLREDIVMEKMITQQAIFLFTLLRPLKILLIE